MTNLHFNEPLLIALGSIVFSAALVYFAQMFRHHLLDQEADRKELLKIQEGLRELERKRKMYHKIELELSRAEKEDDHILQERMKRLKNHQWTMEEEKNGIIIAGERFQKNSGKRTKP